MTETPVPESDRIPGFPHPRETTAFHGHERAEQLLIDAFHSGRLAHAWLFAGPSGVGKATLAYRFAKYVLKYGTAPEAAPRDRLFVDPSDPVACRISAMGHGNLLVLRRPWDARNKRHMNVLPVDEVRRIQDFFSKTAGEGGWRVCIVDTADEMNDAAANALLKTLEEPPSRSLLILIGHSPGRLLATIRSRCRRLNFDPLPDAAVREVLEHTAPDLSPDERDALTAYSGGSPGYALSLIEAGGLDLFHELTEILSALPKVDSLQVMDLGDRLSRASKTGAFALTLDFLSRWARQQALDRVDHHSLGWAESWSALQRLRAMSDGLVLDKKHVVMQAIGELQRASGNHTQVA